MHDLRLPPVQVGERVARFEEPGQGFAFRNRAVAFQPLPDVLALDEIHDQVLAFAFDDEVVGHARGRLG